MGKISQLQIGFLFILYNYSTMTGFWIGPLAGMSPYSAWACLPISAIVGTGVTGLSIWLTIKSGGHPFIIEVGKGPFLKYLRMILMLLCFFFFLHLASYVLREFTDFLSQMYLPTTPESVVAGLFVLTVAVAVRSGLLTIFRCATGFFMIVFAAVLISPALVLSEMNFDRAVALVTHFEPRHLWDAVYTTSPWFGETFTVLFLWPRIKESHKTFRTLLIASLITSVIVAFYFIFCMMLFGPNVTQNLAYPVLEMIRYVRIGDFLENMDPFLEAIWTSSVFVKICLLLYVTVLIASQLLKMKDGRPISFSIAALMLGMSMHMAVSTSELHSFFENSWSTFAWFVEIAAILYLALNYMIQKFRGSRSRSGA